MSLPTLTDWVAHLRQIASPFADSRADLGVGDLADPFRAAACGIAPEPASQPTERGEIGLWWALTDDRIDVDWILSEPTEGSLLPQGLYRTIEVWTDADLSGLHALWWLAGRRNRPDCMRRVEAVLYWHLATTQPDNATYRPWALHVFLLGATPECVHYAETLLHNCQAVNSRPDPLSAWILLDAAKAIESTLVESR